MILKYYFIFSIDCFVQVILRTSISSQIAVINNLLTSILFKTSIQKHGFLFPSTPIGLVLFIDIVYRHVGLT